MKKLIERLFMCTLLKTQGKKIAFLSVCPFFFTSAPPE